MSSLDLDSLNTELGAYCRDNTPRLINGMIFGTRFSSFCTPLSGFQHEKVVSDLVTPQSMVRPYSKTFTPVTGLEYKPRILTLRTAKLELELEPLKYRESFLGHAVRPGANWVDVPFTQYLMTKVTEKANENLEYAFAAGVYDAAGTDHMDVCDGLLTVITDEITAGTISEALGNLVPLGAGAWSESNAYERLEGMFEDAVPPQYWGNPDFVFLLPPEIHSMYNKNFKTLFGAIPYNTSFGRQYLNAGNGQNVELISVPGMSGQNRVILTRRENLFLGATSDSGMMTTQRIDWTIHVLAAFRIGIQIGALDQIWVSSLT